MGYMYYVNLGNKGFCTPDDSDPTSCAVQSGWGPGNTGPFTNLQSAFYWSGLEYAPDASDAWNFSFHRGFQSALNKSSVLFAWAVRSGDVGAPLPEPGTMVLLGAGLGLLGWGRRARRG